MALVLSWSGYLGDMAPDMNFHSLVDVISSQFVSCSQEGILGDMAPDMNFHSLVNDISSQFFSCSQVGNLDDMAKDMNVHSLVDVISSQFVSCSQVRFLSLKWIDLLLYCPWSAIIKEAYLQERRKKTTDVS